MTESNRSERYKRTKKERSSKSGKLKKVLAVFLILVVVLGVRFMTDAYLDNKALDYLKTGEVPDWIEQQYIDEDGAARPGTPLEEVNGIVVHYVANPGSSAEANRNYFNKQNTKVSSHFVVGLNGEIIQCVPLYEQAAASNNRNWDTISIEVCHPDESGKFSNKTMDSLIRLTNWLADTCRLDRDDVIRHYDVTGKLCPKYYVEHEDAWENFKWQIK